MHYLGVATLYSACWSLQVLPRKRGSKTQYEQPQLVIAYSQETTTAAFYLEFEIQFHDLGKKDLASQNHHRMTEWPRLEGTSRIMKLQPLCHSQGHQIPYLILDQAAYSPIQPGLEQLQEWGIHNLSGQPVPAPAYFSQTMVIECTKRGFEGNY